MQELIDKFSINRDEPNEASERISFIDMARSVAILLMLEGHFIQLAIDPNSFSQESLMYAVWQYSRTLTAPLFFVVSGMIFVFLLSKNIELPLAQNTRIRKGIWRAIQLILWGFLLHISVLQLDQYILGKFNSWVFSIHVLQCIGLGLIALIVIFYGFKLINKGSLMLYYLISSVIILALYPMVSSQGYFPVKAHPIIQNLFNGPKSIFPIVPWFAFMFLGGAIGSWIALNKTQITRSWKLELGLVLVGLFLSFFVNHILYFLDNRLAEWGLLNSILPISHLLQKMGMVLIILALIIRIDKLLKLPQKSLFLKIGQNTLAIYLIHSVILYGSISGHGLEKYITNALSALYAIIGALIFITFFVLLIAQMDRLKWLRNQ